MPRPVCPLREHLPAGRSHERAKNCGALGIRREKKAPASREAPTKKSSKRGKEAGRTSRSARTCARAAAQYCPLIRGDAVLFICTILAPRATFSRRTASYVPTAGTADLSLVKRSTNVF